jgi:hypothetical protein
MQTRGRGQGDFGVRRLDKTREQGDVLGRGVAVTCCLGRDVYARNAKRPAAAAPTRPSLTESEPAALSLSCSSPEPEEPLLLVELELDEEVVMEPEAVGPVAGVVPLLTGKGAGTAVVAAAAAAAEEDSAMALETAV